MIEVKDEEILEETTLDDVKKFIEASPETKEKFKDLYGSYKEFILTQENDLKKWQDEKIESIYAEENEPEYQLYTSQYFEDLGLAHKPLWKIKHDEKLSNDIRQYIINDVRNDYTYGQYAMEMWQVDSFSELFLEFKIEWPYEKSITNKISVYHRHSNTEFMVHVIVDTDDMYEIFKTEDKFLKSLEFDIMDELDQLSDNQLKILRKVENNYKISQDRKDILRGVEYRLLRGNHIIDLMIT